MIVYTTSFHYQYLKLNMEKIYNFTIVLHVEMSLSWFSCHLLSIIICLRNKHANRKQEHYQKARIGQIWHLLIYHFVFLVVSNTGLHVSNYHHNLLCPVICNHSCVHVRNAQATQKSVDICGPPKKHVVSTTTSCHTAEYSSGAPIN